MSHALIIFPTHGFSPNSFTVGVLNSILKCVRLVSGAVSASGRFVFQFICLPIHLSPRSCVRLCPPPGDLSPNSFVSQFICLPGPVSGAVSASGGFVSQFICPPCVRGCVRLRTICLPIHLSPNSFVSQVLVSQFICLPGPVAGAVSASGGLVSQFICLPIHLSPRSCVRGCVRLRGICLPIRLSSIIPQTAYCWGTQFYLKMCPPCVRGCVRLVSGAVSASLGSVSPISPQTVYCWRSQFSFKRCPAMFRWWCLALRMSRIHLSPCGNSFVSQSGWWCPALWLSPIHLFALISTHLFPSLAGGVRLFGCLQFICLPLWQLICLPIWLVVSGFGCLQFICLALWQLICLPVWLVVSGSSAVSVTLVMSGSLAVSNLFVSKSGWWRLCLPNDSFVSQSGWWCPAFRLAPIHLSPLVTLHLSPSLAGGVRLSGCLQFICFRLVAIHLSPSLAGGVRLSMLSAVSNSFVFPCGN